MHGWRERMGEGGLEERECLHDHLKRDLLHFWENLCSLRTHCRKDNKLFDALLKGQYSKFKLCCEL